MNDSHSSWLAAYLYYAEPWTTFLGEAVHPFVQQVCQQGLAHQFFFIRYWQHGPHIRLRFKGEPECLQQGLKPLVIEFFGRYFTHHPSHHIRPDWAASDPNWVTSDTILFPPYHPEVARYGGEQGILIAEKQFHLSSQVVLDLIRQSQEWHYERALGAAIQLHLGFAHALGLDLHQARQFFGYIATAWFFKAYGLMGQGDKEARQTAALNAFAESFAPQKEALVHYHQQVWHAFEQGNEFESAWMNQWLQGTRLIGDALRRAYHHGELTIPQPAQTTPLTAETQPLWFIWDSYIHMTNNRLGILNHDEAYLGYLLKRSLEYV